MEYEEVVRRVAEDVEGMFSGRFPSRVSVVGGGKYSSGVIERLRGSHSDCMVGREVRGGWGVRLVDIIQKYEPDCFY